MLLPDCQIRHAGVRICQSEPSADAMLLPDCQIRQAAGFGDAMLLPDCQIRQAGFGMPCSCRIAKSGRQAGFGDAMLLPDCQIRQRVRICQSEPSAARTSCSGRRGSDLPIRTKRGGMFLWTSLLIKPCAQGHICKVFGRLICFAGLHRYLGARLF